MADVAERLYAYMEANKMDVMMVFYLRHPEIINENDFCKKMKLLMEKIGGNISKFNETEFRYGFFSYFRLKMSEIHAPGP